MSASETGEDQGGGRAASAQLRFVDDLSLPQIAEALNVPLGTVKSRLHNALEALKRRA